MNQQQRNQHIYNSRRTEVQPTHTVNTGNENNSSRRKQSSIKKFVLEYRNQLGCLFFTGVLLILILVPLSYKYVEYDEYALKKNTLTNKLVNDKTYSNGMYFWGLNYDTVIFPRQYQKVAESYAIFPTNGLEFNINVIFWYKIKKDFIQTLFNSFGTSSSLRDQVINRANAKIKNVAPNFSIEEYITRRDDITATLFQSLSEELETIHIELNHEMFWLGSVSIPEEIKERDLDASVQNQANIEEQNKQLAILVRKETDKLVQDIAADINLIFLSAEAQADRIVLEAQAEAEKISETANGIGLQSLFNNLNITSTLVKEKYMSYFVILDNLDNDQLVALNNKLDYSIEKAL